METVVFKMEVEVRDSLALLKAAVDRCVRDGLFTEDDAVAELFPDGIVDIAGCIQMLADPGVSFPGTSILETSAAELAAVP